MFFIDLVFFLFYFVALCLESLMFFIDLVKGRKVGRLASLSLSELSDMAINKPEKNQTSNNQ